MQQSLDALFSALADPTRRAIIERLARGRATVSELAAPHAMALPSFMRHLKVLETAGLVRSVKKGRVRSFRIDAAAILEAQGWLAWQREVWERRLDALDQLDLNLDDPEAP